MPSTIFDQLAIYPDRGVYLPGEDVNLVAHTSVAQEISIDVKLTIYRGLDEVETRLRTWMLHSGDNTLKFSFPPAADPPAGYGVELTCYSEGGELPVARAQTAFDVLQDWTDFPRYGFLCDFSPSRTDVSHTIETLTSFHLNGLQFYDWQYRHDSLVPPAEEFIDPLGRSLSLRVIRELIDTAHVHGMKAMPYLAIYAASAGFWRAHPEWMLYDKDHRPIPFGDSFLGIMDPTAGGGWQQHLLEECRCVLRELPFDGLHIDQYGDPKEGYNVAGDSVDLPTAFSDFIGTAAQQHPGKPVLFNAVGNWPIDSLAKSPVAFNYVEIWPPATGYDDVVEIVRNARRLSGQKPVIIALYIPAARKINNRLADAMIFSAGGSRIELGEDGKLLSDPYFPKHEALDEELSDRLKYQMDLMLRYEEWIGPLVEESPLPPISAPAWIEFFFRRTTKGYSLSMVNLSGETPLCWDEDHSAPKAYDELTVRVELEAPIRRAWLVSPDSDSFTPQPVKFEQNGNHLSMQIPSLEVWGVLLLEK